MALKINKKYDEEKQIWNLELSGEVDVYTVDNLKDTFSKMIEEKKETIKIDANNLEYIDSTGLGVLIGAFKKLKVEGKTIILYNVKSSIKKLFNITGLDKIFIIEG